MTEKATRWLAPDENGVTLVEVVVAIAVITIFAVTVFSSLTVLNQQAMVDRLYTGALAAAQNQIDWIQSLPPSSLPIASSTSPPVTIYSDPQFLSSGTITPIITGTMYTTMVLTGSTALVSGTNFYYHFYGANVTVLFNFPPSNPIPYSVSLSTVRTDAP